MSVVVGIRFKKAGKIYYFAPANTGVTQGDFAIVETIRGIEYGEVVVGPKEVSEKELISPLKPVIRKGTNADAFKNAENKKKEQEAFPLCLEKINKHKLEMRLVDVEYTFDCGKVIFYFTADGRIDFRELVKDLAAVFRTRIELRQIGVRDEAKMLGGIGCCGRPLCCATFLGDFEPVSIRMAKNQNLSLNPTKISGVCGRLLCCLKYEDHVYCEKNCSKCGKQDRLFVKKGMMVATPVGDGKVVSVNGKEHSAGVEISPGNVVTVGWDEMVELSKVED